MSKLIRENTTFLKNRIKDYQERLDRWQSECPHDIVEGQYKASTGNWCPQDDSYWITATCLDCGKHIFADSNTELYRKLSGSGMISSEYDSKDVLVRQHLLRLEIERAREESTND